MAIISCPKCCGEISDLAASCPNCGIPVSPERPSSSANGKKTVWGATIFGILFIVFIGGVLTLVMSDGRSGAFDPDVVKSRHLPNKTSLEYFIKHREDVLADIKGMIDDGDYREAARTAGYYLQSNDPELKSLHKIARATGEN